MLELPQRLQYNNKKERNMLTTALWEAVHMKQTSFPQISEITIDNIAEHCRNTFGVNKGEFEQTVFHAGGWLSRIRRGKSKMSDYHYQQMFNLLKSKSGGDSRSFVSEMQYWYPSLKSYTNENDIAAVIRANLESRASGTAKCTMDESEHDLNNLQFLKTCLAHDSPIKCIKMAAQTGWRWFDDHERTNLLTQLAQKEIAIQVIGNPSSPVMKKIAGTMRDPAKKLRYMGLNDTLAKWHDYEKAYPHIKFRVSEYPIFRQTLIVEFEDNSSRGFFRDYAYGSPIKCSSPHRQVSSGELDFNYYSEFEFLWGHAQTYEQWYAALPEPEETLKPSHYVLVYPSHGRGSEDHSKWVYSALSISEDNAASLKVNIAASSDAIESNNDGEYSYQGSLKLARNHIFLSLYDNEQQEAINISFVRPLHEKERFIGIMTALSPSGHQPVAFKCACIGRSILPKLNYQTLNKLLSHNNRVWDDNLLVLEDQDINLFYSDRLLTDRSR